MAKHTRYTSGIISGFVFGIFCVVFAIFGLVSVVAEIIGRLLFFPGQIVGLALGGSMVALFLVNGVFYALLGFIMQHILRKSGKNERIVLYVFAGFAALCAIAVVAEALVKGGLSA